MKSIGIIGSGTAGLVAALILRQRYLDYDITVVSSKEIGIIGVGEGTTEHWKDFSNFCGKISKSFSINVSVYLNFPFS